MKYAAAVLALLLLGVLAWSGYRARQYDVLAGEAKALRATLAVTRDSLEVALTVAAKTDTVYRTKWLPKYTTVRVTDTVMRGDTVYVRRDIADSTVTSCTLALTACQVAGIKRDSVIAQQQRLIEVLEKKPGPCRFLGARCEIITGVLGITLGVIIAK